MDDSWFARFATWRKEHLKLSNPGTYEQLNKEIKQCFLSNYFFDGARADLTKMLSPSFQVTHSFSTGSSTIPSSYNMNAVFMEEKTLLQGSVDNEGTVQGRIHHHWTPKMQSKIQLALSNQPGHSMIQAEMDYQGLDFTANLKAVNPSPVDKSGIFVASYLQSITPNLALGVEYVLQRPNSVIEESALSYAARYSHEEGKAISTAQLQAGGVLQVSHWRRVDAMVDAGAELQVVLGQKREAVCSVGARWEFSSASFRGMIDTKGKVMMVLEERLAPGFAVLMNGELDHWNGKSRFGLGLQMET